MGFPRAGSNPAGCEIILICFLTFYITLFFSESVIENKKLASIAQTMQKPILGIVTKINRQVHQNPSQTGDLKNVTSL